MKCLWYSICAGALFTLSCLNWRWPKGISRWQVAISWRASRLGRMVPIENLLRDLER